LEAQADIHTYIERGKQALAEGQGREAALAYAQAAQIEPHNVLLHLGLAEANLALGNYDFVRMACHRVQELQPSGGVEAMTAQALLDLLDRRYDRALQNVNDVIEQDPAIAYVHALRSHLLRATGQDYDANLARARAARLSYGGRFDNCFPEIERDYASGYATSAYPPRNDQGMHRVEREAIPTWSRANGLQRQVVRTRFVLSQYPGLITNILIAVNVIVFLLGLINQNLFFALGAQVNNLVGQGEYWRIFTAMFLHANILHIGLNMFSLFFVGRAVEQLFGKWRYLLIYLLSGIAGGLTYYFTSPMGETIGASGAIFGIFGALGIFYIVNRRALGSYASAVIGQWVFWLVLNLAFGLSPGINIIDHIGGLVAGMIIAALLMPRLGVRRGL